jgi:glycerophosphoryl diester phosphodiesterase
MWVTVWTVNEPADIRKMLDLGVDGIACDYPDRVIAELKKRGERR